MVSSTYLVALIALLGSTITSAHAHRNAAEEVRSRRQARIGAKGSLDGPAQGCYTLPDSFKPPTGQLENLVTGALEPAANDIYMTASRCARACVNLKKEVVAVSGTDCMCGSLLPKKKDQVEDKKCDQTCKGWGDVKCGSLDNYWSFWLSGLKSNVGNEEDPEEVKSSSIASASRASASAASKTTQPTASPTESVDKAGKTITLTPSASETIATEEKKGPNKVGIAVGVVVGVLVLAGAAGAFYFWYRKTRRNELEEEYKRQAAIAAFVAPSTDASSYDTRLDTAALRRMSDGSIADNQDYSRRILKVTNA